MHFSFCLSVSAMSLNNLSYSDLQRRLDDPQQRDELVQLAREARPGRANWLFSDARNFTAVPYQVQRVAVEAGDWRKGFWSDCSWRKGPLELGSDNEITRKHSVQCTDSTAVTSVSLPNLDFASICARDERRLEKACRRKRRKRQQSTSSS